MKVYTSTCYNGLNRVLKQEKPGRHPDNDQEEIIKNVILLAEEHRIPVESIKIVHREIDTENPDHVRLIVQRYERKTNQ